MSLILAGQSETELRGHLSLPRPRAPLSVAKSLAFLSVVAVRFRAPGSHSRQVVGRCWLFVAHRSTKLYSSGFIQAGPMPLGVIPAQTDVRRTHYRSLAQVKDQRGGTIVPVTPSGSAQQGLQPSPELSFLCLISASSST